jgi:hypothetical protein
MPIPKEILAVQRPKNSIVIAYGKNRDHYAVRKRIGCRSDGDRRLPVNGPTIGHIVGGRYVPLEEAAVSPVSASAVDLKDWANVMLAQKLFSYMIDELCEVYSKEDALKIWCIAVLRVCFSGIKDYELKDAYEESFLSELYPGVALSRNTVSTFLNDLGRTCSRITLFMCNRASRVGMDHHLLIDGTLKSDESRVNSLSDFSRKARTKGTRDISVLYAFDLEAMEPVCSKCFPGNMLDVTAYSEFISEHHITKGIVVADKGFPQSAAKRYFKDNPDLHYLNPLKRNSKIASELHMLEFTGQLRGYGGITYRKEKACDDRWLYSFRDAYRAAKEESDWLKRSRKKNDYCLADLQKARALFGTVFLECDMDIEPETIYKAYSKRWEIEIVMRFYKSALEFDETRVHDDYSVIGSEFCDFLSSVLTFRMIQAFDKAKILEEMPYKKVMKILARAKIFNEPGHGWRLIRINPSYEELLKRLDMHPTEKLQPKKKRGRPPKIKHV